MILIFSTNKLDAKDCMNFYDRGQIWIRSSENQCCIRYFLKGLSVCRLEIDVEPYS